MRKLPPFLIITILILTPLFAMEEQGGPNKIGWGNPPEELLLDILNRLDNAKDACNAAQVNQKWCLVANEDKRWKERVQKDFSKEREKTDEGKTWKETYQNLKEEWIFDGDFNIIADSKCVLNRDFAIRPRNQKNSTITTIDAEGFKNGDIRIEITTKPRQLEVQSEVQSKLLQEKLVKDITYSDPLNMTFYTSLRNDKLPEFLAVFVENHLIPPLVEKVIFSKINAGLGRKIWFFCKTSG